MENSNGPKCGSVRFGVLILSTALIAIVTANSVVWNPSIVVITDIRSSPKWNGSVMSASFYNDENLSLSDRRMLYSPMEKSFLFACGFGFCWLNGLAVFIGLMLGIFPVEIMLRRFGGYWATIVMGLVSAISSALIPTAVGNSFVLLVILRLLLGSAMPIAFPMISTIISNWSSQSDMGIFVSVLTGYLQITALFTNPVTVGWASVFYIHSAILALLVFCWILFYRDTPESHRFVGEKEIRKISVGKELSTLGTLPSTPYRAICTSVPIWGIWIAAAANYFVAQFPIVFWPTYLVNALGYSLKEAGFLAIIPFSLQFLTKCVTGMVADRIGFLSPLNTIRLMNSVAFVGTAVLFVVAILLAEQPIAHLAALIAAIAVLGTNAGGFPRSAVIVSKQHSRFVLTVLQCVMCLALCVGSFVVPALTPNSSVQEYSFLFILYAVFLFIANVIFVWTATADPLPFTRNQIEPQKVIP